MPNPARRRLRLARRGLGYVAAGVLIAMALVAGAVSQLLPLAERHPDRIAAWLSDRAKRPVAFDRVESEWTRRGPLLRLDNLRIGGRDGIVIGDAEILVSQYAGLLPGRSFTELRVHGLDLTLERGADGRWRVRGFPGQRSSSDPFAQLEGLGELQVVGARLGIDAPALGIRTTLPRVDVRLRVDGSRVRAGLRAWMRAGGAPVDAVFAFDRRRGDGRGWFAARRADLAQWTPLLRFAGIGIERGGGDAQAWATLRDRQVVAVLADVALDDVALRGADARVALGAVAGRARWSQVEGGWRIDIPRMRIGADAARQALDGVVVAGGRRYALVARRIDARPLLAVASLGDRVAPGLRRWLQAAAPTAQLEDVEVAGLREGPMRARARITALGFRPAGRAPGLRGLSGTLEGDDRGLVFRPDPARTVDVDWPGGFGVVHPVKLRGAIAGWREGAGWRTQAASLRIEGDGYAADARGGLWFQGDGTRPWIDLAVRIDDTQVAMAKRFWIRQSMSPRTVEWLDRALVAGAVRDGRAIVSGDLDDWPFRNNDGRFEAHARLQDATVRFNPEWPAADHLDGDVAFVADGFEVRGSGAIAGVAIPRLQAGIEHFRRAQLKIEAEGKADATQLLALLRQSPLRTRYGDTLANLDARGPAAVTFRLDQPLYPGGPVPVMEGMVALSGARLADARWKLAFDDVRGRARYDRAGFAAENLDVRHDGRAGRLSLRAGGDVRGKGNAFEAELEATLRADDLLDRAPDLAWLKPRVEGASTWTIAVALPANASAATPSRLQLRSSLAGTSLSLPAPLEKPAATSLPTTVDVALPLGDGDITVAFGNRLALRARSANGRTGIRAVLGATRVDAAPPASGLVASGRTDVLDAIGWATLGLGGAPAPPGTAQSPAPRRGEPLALRDVDVSADRLLLLGAQFPSTRVRARPSAAGTAVQLDGAALSGTLQLPARDGAALTGRLQRLHWRAQKATAASTPQDRAPTANDDTDPRKVPPLDLVVDDLRFGDARLGRATLRTRPTANGLRIVQLQARAPKQSIDVTGDWTGPAAMRTRLQVRLQSDDFGALLAGFGFGGQVRAGKGSAAFDAGWPGSPAAFRLAGLDGSLRLDVRDGQLVEIEPGAGRVLGLLSIAQLPRRLTLDFRDFFDKGFAFDKVQGEIRFANASARSDNLVIDGPAAEIRIRGAADLRAQAYDQTIEVYPKAGNLLAVAGAIAGGPVGAAIGAAANAVLKKPLGQLAARTYRVTGPWKEPKVEVVGRTTPARAAERREGQ